MFIYQPWLVRGDLRVIGSGTLPAIALQSGNCGIVLHVASVNHGESHSTGGTFGVTVGEGGKLTLTKPTVYAKTSVVNVCMYVYMYTCVRECL
jgi:hypothetical protein